MTELWTLAGPHMGYYLAATQLPLERYLQPDENNSYKSSQPSETIYPIYAYVGGYFPRKSSPAKVVSTAFNADHHLLSPIPVSTVQGRCSATMQIRKFRIFLPNNYTTNNTRWNLKLKFNVFTMTVFSVK